MLQSPWAILLFNYWASCQLLATFVYAGIVTALLGLANLALPFRFLGIRKRAIATTETRVLALDDSARGAAPLLAIDCAWKRPAPASVARRDQAESGERQRMNLRVAETTLRQKNAGLKAVTLIATLNPVSQVLW